MNQEAQDNSPQESVQEVVPARKSLVDYLFSSWVEEESTPQTGWQSDVHLSLIHI